MSIFCVCASGFVNQYNSRYFLNNRKYFIMLAWGWIGCEQVEKIL